MSVNLADQSWPKLRQAIDQKALILVPIGQTEEHGPHLPIKTDALIAEQVAKTLAERMNGEIPTLVTPTIWSGYSMRAISNWPGTIRLRPETFMNMVFEICGSLVEMGFVHIMLISTHGNHPGMLRAVVRRIADQYDVHMALTFPVIMADEVFQQISKAGKGGSCHAGEYETSLMLYLAENLVEMDKCTAEDKITYSSTFYPGKVYWSTWGIQKSKTGVHGDPTVATKQTGEKTMKAIISNYESFAREFYHFRVENNTACEGG